MTYDKTTVNSLMSLFRTPDDIDLQNLQHQAISKLKEYRESSALSLQYVIDNHDLMDVDIRLMSSYFILPHSGVFTEKCACAIVNLGKLKIFQFHDFSNFFTFFDVFFKFRIFEFFQFFQFTIFFFLYFYIFFSIFTFEIIF